MLRTVPRWQFHLFLACLVVLGCLMRFHHIEQRSLWADELFTLRMANYHPLVPAPGEPWYRAASVLDIRDGDTFLTAKAGEQSPPLQDLLEKFSVRLLGFNEFAARLPGALAACALLCWFAWFAARSKDDWERRVLTWSLLLLVLSPALVAYATDARAYSLGASLVGMGGLLWLLRWRHGWRHVPPPGWGEIVLFVLACYTHYNAAVLVMLLLGCDAVLACKTRSRTAWVRLITLGVLFSLWVAVNAHTILFTARGGVAWGHYTPLQQVFATFTGALTIVHLPWSIVVAILAWTLLAWRFFRRSGERLPMPWIAWFFLMSVMLVHAIAAGLIVAKAGMGHTRYYIFIVPLFAVAFGMLLAELRGPWAMLGAALFVSALAVPGMRSQSLLTLEDFRGMTQRAVEGTDKDTLFIYPWGPNRDLYRIYLDRFLGQDTRPQMVGVSWPDDVPAVCKRLSSARHVVVVAHDSGRPRIDEVYAACGAMWPQRIKHQFHNTFTEHWHAVADAATTAK